MTVLEFIKLFKNTRFKFNYRDGSNVYGTQTNIRDFRSCLGSIYVYDEDENDIASLYYYNIKDEKYSEVLNMEVKEVAEFELDSRQCISLIVKK